MAVTAARVGDGVLTSQELADLRSESERAMVDTCVVLRPSWTADGQGGSVAAFSPAATVPCAVWPKDTANTESVVGGRFASLNSWRVAVPHGADVRVTDRLVLSAGTVEVSAVLDPRTHTIVRTLECGEVT